MPKPSPQDLEKLIHQTLRSLPDREAPRSLEHRVLAAIAARQALPWWRQSFTHWPVAARSVFLVASAVFAAAVLAGFFRATGEVQATSLLAGPLEAWARVQAFAAAISDLGGVVWRSIPSLWIYGALAFAATMYAAFFGLGAAAYRTFFAQR